MVVVADVVVDLRGIDTNHQSTIHPSNHPPKRVKLPLKDQLTSEGDAEEGNSSAILAQEDQFLEKIRGLAEEEPTGDNLVPKLKRQHLEPQVMNLRLSKNLLREKSTKRRRMNPSLKSQRKPILLNGKNNNRKRRLLYKLSFNNNKRNSVKPTTEIVQHSRVLLRTKRTKNLLNLLPQKKKRPKRNLKKRRLSHSMKSSQSNPHPNPLHHQTVILMFPEEDQEAVVVSAEDVEAVAEAREHLSTATVVNNTRVKQSIFLTQLSLH